MYNRYKRNELERLDKSKLIDIILEQERQLALSAKGQPKRDNLIGESFGALTVIADAGNEQGHSTWLCRCSGDLRHPTATNVCDRTMTAWGSNLKGKRQQYCGHNKCPAAKQMLAKRRQKERGLKSDENEFLSFLESELYHKYALMGDRAEELASASFSKLEAVFRYYYGFVEDGKAYKLNEISKIIHDKEVVPLRKIVEEYICKYQGTKQ